MCAIKKGADFERLAKIFLEKILEEIGYEVVRSRNQNSGTQDGYDNAVVVVDKYFRHSCIYVECKDYSTQLNHAAAMEKIPHIISTHSKIDLLLFISPYRDFSNPNEDLKLADFYEVLSDACPVEFLTPNAFVKEYFSLYPELYKPIYNLEPEPVKNERRQQLLSKFEKLLFSDKNLKKIIIDESHRHLYIGDIINDPHHINRSLRSENEENIYEWGEDDRKFLGDVLSTSKWGVVLLGNPGYGKTSELKDFAVTLWENRETRMQIPKYERLREFNSGMTIENLLPENYQNIGSLIVILDGIDEIYDIADFTNKLRRFFLEKRQYLDEGSIKFIVSCRTNIYLKYIKVIENLEPYFINGVSEGGAVRFLHNKFNINLVGRKEFDFWRFRDIIQNPFYLEMIGKSLVINPDVVISRPKLIESYIDLRLEEDFTDKNRNDIKFSKAEQLQIASELAIAFEMMQRSELKENEVRVILGDGRDCSKNPFLEQSSSSTWSFEHKNIQEYLTARSLSLLSFESIIELISIASNIQKVHPSWHNVISFLLNMSFNSLTYKKLVDWLVKYDLELVFSADPGSIPENIKNSALQTIFHSTTLDQSLWLPNISAIATLGNTEVNVHYLFDKLEDSSLHVRARMSASSLLREMSLTEKFPERLESVCKQLVVEFIASPGEMIYFMEDVLKLALGVQGPDKPAIATFLITELREFDQREIVRPILDSINGTNLAQYIDYVLDILSKAIKEKPWNQHSKYGSLVSTKEKIFNLFCKVKDPLLLMQIFQYLIERHKNYELREKEVNEFYVHITAVFKIHVCDIKVKLVELITDAVLGDKIRHFEDDLLVNLVKVCHLQEAIAERVLVHTSQRSIAVHFVAAILNDRLIQMIINAYNCGELDGVFLNSLRNITSYDDIDLGILFQSITENRTNYRFEVLFDKAEREDEIAFNLSREQADFDMKFDKQGLITDMEKIYDHFGVQILSYKRMEIFTKLYYEKVALRKRVNAYSKQFLREIIHKDYKVGKGLNRNNLLTVLEGNELDRMEDIQNNLPTNDRIRVVVNDQQKQEIEAWCLDNQQIAMDFYDDSLDDQRLTCQRTVRLILGFQKHFKFKTLNPDLLFKMIWDSADHEKLNLDYMDGVVPRDRLHQHILSLLDDENLSVSCQFLLYQYLRDKGLEVPIYDARLKREIFSELTIGNNYYPRQIIKLFFKNDVPLLKMLLLEFGLDKRHSHFILFLLEQLNKNGEGAQVELFLVKNQSILIVEGSIEEKAIISILMRNNSKLAFELVYQKMQEKLVESEPLISGYGKSWESYSNKDAIPVLLNIIDAHISGFTGKGIYDRTTTSAIRMATEALLSIAKAHDEDLCLSVLDDFLSRKFIGNDHDDIFYLNGFKRDIENVTSMHRSKPYKLGQAVEILQKYKYDLI
ncbi:hypothetical protein SAMN04487898_10374 [Pedobacter sp. ok626]|uniref:NACHT domain-containing protein n=1 Tax=Pedobacter sp. ok626 TaxID=1761882 RepID=UPI000890B368|nr:hypothetical protein [Pedobacter sp. ok626]SDJ49176.1 hypothetical protein SAMN04487898_10374 [Pedobacter sp. ok626]